MRFAEAVAELDARQPERMVPDLSRITALAGMLDHPELTYPSVHVTGTNGKTTTARIVTSIACAHGLTAGTYTSPHLESVTERIALCGDAIPEDEFAAEYERLLPYFREVDGRGERVTYFEALTALAYLWFADKPVSLGVFEVGMGGVWDATNLVSSDVAVICPIALDHPELGSTVEAVATEKAGIIKAGKVAVCRGQPPHAMQVIEERAREVGAEIVLEGRDFGLEDRRQAVGGQRISVRSLHGTYRGLDLPVFGEHAARNAAAAVAATESLFERALSEVAVRAALAFTSVPGRLEVLERHPLLVVDGAHNPAGAEALAAAISDSFAWDRLHLVIAVSSNKDVDGVVRPLARLADHAYATRHSTPRSAPEDRVAAACTAAGIETSVHGSIPDALDAARASAGADDLILVTGSLYTVADARRTIATHA